MYLCVATIYSATFDPTRGASHRYITQFYAIALGLVAMMFMLTLDYRTFTDKSHLVYIGLILVLVYVLFSGKEMKGARRWIMLKGPPLKRQPWDFEKIGGALVRAKFLGENRGEPQAPDLVVGAGLTLIPLALIAKQPDLGTAVTLL